jgi:uncharacterized repeat protein (TIGR04076 family)
MLEIEVYRVDARCPVYKPGDKVVIGDPRILLDRIDALCTHALSTLLHYVTLLEHCWCPVELGLTTPDEPEYAYMQCVDPGKPYTEGGTVLFRCQRIPRESGK